MSSKLYITVFSIVLGWHLGFSQIKVLDSISKSPVSYATISFGNGQGIFADDDGVFYFTKKLYPDVDSLHISAIGFKNLNIAAENLPNQLLLQPQADALDEVVLSTNLNRKFKEETLKPYLDDDYYNCWLPTIESEIAVYFSKFSEQDQKLTSVTFPIALESKDWNKRKRANSDKKKFSTLFKVQFYANDNGKPGKVLTYETIVFRATEKNGDAYELSVEDYDIYIPKNGFFVSIQVMGYTNKEGKLLPNKKYKEIKTKNGVVKIPTNFRPLLPFTDEIESKNTYIKRIFISGNNWVKFDKGNGFKSSLLDKNLFNYGIGITYKTFKDE
ncbi:carboxypeptidase-like regulatory domain-containing protein [Winogradskyella sp. MH6]|uniref:carboxypeptidase-like regulatory domain-containing protein n=1 Tax=Winogradskyella sp. MH6 TaxID=2929510 RepID=UPI001FB5419C|nr:carboxypeptidase-like regulatory domain-containing protein [Winogradskyella sp. MH6]